ncbi:MAG: hypothetical protein ABI903_08065 [Actinomycetota bacterium]
MTDQPPVQPPHQPSGNPSQPPAQAPTANAAPTTNLWRQATSTRGGRWAIALVASAVVFLMLLGVGVAGLLLLRNHDRFDMVGHRQGGFSRGQLGPGSGRDDGGNNGRNPLKPGVPQAPGLRGGGAQGLGGLGGVLGGGALHGNMTTTVNGSVQALVFQRGQVTALSSTSITLKSSDGFVGTYGRADSTTSLRGAPVTGGQAFVLARASDKVAITIFSVPVNGGVGPSS